MEKIRTFPTLYSATSTGGTNVWTIVVRREGEYGTIETTYGAHLGKQQTTTRTITEGKNLGRSNATTPFEQACLDAERAWKKKQDSGYVTKAAHLVTKQKPLRPMLALKYDDRSHDVVWPAFVQPKLNGARCLAERRGDEIVFHSRGGKTFELPHIASRLLTVMTDGEILDGEIYNHQQCSFQELMGYLKDPSKLNRERFLQFWNYDCVSDAPFRERQTRLVRSRDGVLVRVPTYRVADEAAMRQRHAEFMSEGYEGTMVRSGGDAPYRQHFRSPSLLKVKDFQDDDFVIVGAKEGLGKAVGQAILICRLPDGQTFECRCMGTDDDRRAMWTNRAALVGQRLTVKYQYLSDAGIPIFPVGVSIRDYE